MKFASIGIHIKVKSRVFKCSSLNALSIVLQTQSLVKIGSRIIASEEVTFHVVKGRCLPVQYYLLVHVCPLSAEYF